MTERPHAPTGTRGATLDAVAEGIVGTAAAGTVRVAVDGVDGAGKTHFGNELAAVLRVRGLRVVRASVDSFHRPAEQRYRRGRDSPDGFFHDSFDLDAVRTLLLEPMGPDGNGRAVRAIHDVHRDRTVERVVEDLSDVDVLVVDGIFLHRPELRDCWEYTIFLEVAFAVSVARCAERDGGDPDPAAATNRRYVRGQRLYLETCHPREHATVVVANDDLADARVR